MKKKKVDYALFFCRDKHDQGYHRNPHVSIEACLGCEFADIEEIHNRRENLTVQCAKNKEIFFLVKLKK